MVVVMKAYKIQYRYSGEKVGREREREKPMNGIEAQEEKTDDGCYGNWCRGG